MNKRPLPLLLMVLIFAPSTVFATEAFEFVSDVIQSLGICKVADSRVKEKHGQDNDMYSLMKDLRVFTDEINRAKTTIERHANSKNSLIKDAATLYYNTYSFIIVNKEQDISFLEEKLNNPADVASKQGTWLRRESEIGAKNEELWSHLIHVTILSTYTLIDTNRLDKGKTGFLTITKTERDSLITELKNEFGKDLPTGLKAGQYPIEASASTFKKILTDPWKASDSK
jgi:hypothetical protein